MLDLAAIILHVLRDYLIPFLLMMALLVSVHEGGHFLAARLLGIKVTEFSIGLGPALLKFTDRSGCTWRLGPVLVGGYVKMAGEGSTAGVRASAPAHEIDGAARDGSFRLRPLSHRALVIAAGPAANLLFGFLVLSGVFLSYGRAVTPPVVVSVEAQSPAAAAGIRPGDVITAAEGVRVRRYEDVVSIVGNRIGVPVILELQRDGKPFAVELIPFKSKEDAFGRPQTVARTGIIPSAQVFEPIGLIGAAVESLTTMADMAQATTTALLETATLSRDMSDISGPVHMAEVSGDALSKFGFVTFLAIAAVLSVNLAVVNLLPIPILDGGHLLVFAYEAVAGVPASPFALSLMYRCGAVFLLGLLAVVSGCDIGFLMGRLLSGG